MAEMKVIRKDAREIHEAMKREHEKLLEQHEARVAEVRRLNDEAMEQHTERVEEAERFHERATEAGLRIQAQSEEEHAQAHARYAESVESLKGLRGGLNKLVGRARELPPPPDEPPQVILPEKPEIPDPVLIPEPPEPEFTHEPPTYIVRDAQVGMTTNPAEPVEPWEIVETPWGLARAHLGAKVLTDEATGAVHVVAPKVFEQEYIVVQELSPSFPSR